MRAWSVDQIPWSAERGYHPRKGFADAAVGKRCLSTSSSGRAGRSQTTKGQEFADKRHDHFMQARLSPARIGKICDCFRYLERITDVATEHLIHVGDQCH